MVGIENNLFSPQQKQLRMLGGIANSVSLRILNLEL